MKDAKRASDRPSRSEERTGYRSGDRASPAPTSEAFKRSSLVGTPTCDVCGSPMLDCHCKLICLTCGYQRDCSDP